jgi:hypothetical protein
MPPEYNARCVSAHPEDLASGRSVAPGERFHLSADDQKEPANKRLIDEGLILISTKKERGDA